MAIIGIILRSTEITPMRHFFSSLVFVISVYARSAAAHEGAGCSNIDDNSCWHTVNRGESPVSVRCQGYGKSNLFSAASLPQEGVYSYQYCQAWADGLGYFEPGVAIQCQVASADGRSAVVKFNLGDFGDRVAIMTTQDEVVVVVRGYWADKVQVARADLL